MNNDSREPNNSLAACKPEICGADTDFNALQLNNNCYCKTFDRKKFIDVLNADELYRDLLLTHPQLFSNTAVFISPSQLNAMHEIIGAVERIVALPDYQKNALQQASESTGEADNVNGELTAKTSGVFMGYDFHLTQGGAKVIEINTNAGGAFLNSVLMSAQNACCGEPALPQTIDSSGDVFVNMFRQEWRHQRGDLPLRRIAIVDENPQTQFLYPEFKIAQQIFLRHGIDAIIAAPEALLFANNQLTLQGQTIDLVYNRLTDFSLTEKHNQHLLAAYQADAVVLTPNPYHHAIYADKRNLIVFSDEKKLNEFGASANDIDILKKRIPKTLLVTPDNATELWGQRKHYFFKPASGFGSKAAYRGDKLTKRVWEDILQGRYVAQELVLPTERGVSVDEEKAVLKMDIRAYVYEGQIQLLAARLYQGQTTNFRTSGGGFAPVYVVP